MGKIRCLIIDDEQPAIDRLARLLGKNPAIELVGHTTDVDQALSLIQKTDPDLIFLDVEMPDKSGFEVVAELQNNGFHSTIIFVTAFDHYAIKAIRAQAFDYLLKPVDIDELNEAIDRYLKKQEEKKNINIPQTFVEKFGLTKRETEILHLLAQGKTSQQIAEQLFLSKLTVDTHRRHILEKTNFKNTTELIEYLLITTR